MQGYVQVIDVLGDTWAFTANFGGDVSGATWLAQLRSDPESATIIATATVDATQAALGVVTWSFTAATTAALTVGRYWTDLQRTVGGAVYTWPRVCILAEKDVSRV